MLFDSTKWNPQKDIALRLWEELKRKAKKKGFIRHATGNKLYVYNFPIFGDAVYFPITIYDSFDGHYYDCLWRAEYEDITEDWTVKDLSRCDESEDDFENDDFFMSDNVNEEKKFIKIISSDKTYGNIHAKDLDIETLANFIRMIVPAHWNIVTAQDDLKQDNGILNIELTLYGFEKGQSYQRGMDFTFVPHATNQYECAGLCTGIVVYRNGSANVKIAIQPVPYFDWRVTAIHELAHVASHRHEILKTRDCPDVEWFMEHNNCDFCCYRSYDRTHGKQFKKAMDRFRERYRKAVESNSLGR